MNMNITSRQASRAFTAPQKAHVQRPVVAKSALSSTHAAQQSHFAASPQQQQLVNRQQQQTGRGARLVASAAPAAEKGMLGAIDAVEHECTSGLAAGG
jgi:hypothetical protein